MRGSALPLLLGSVLADLGSVCDLLAELVGFGFEEPDAGLGQAVGAHVAAGDGPFELLCQLGSGCVVAEGAVDAVGDASFEAADGFLFGFAF